MNYPHSFPHSSSPGLPGRGAGPRSSQQPYSQSYSQSQPSGSQRRGKPRCPQCGSRRFLRDSASGMLACEEGHVLQGFREEMADDDAAQGPGGTFQLPGTRLRRLRKGKRKVVGKEPAVDKRMWGAHAGFRGYQSLQLMLRLQLLSLRRLFPHFPHADIEALAREYWSIFLFIMEKDAGSGSYSLVPVPIDDPADSAQEGEGSGANSRGPSSSQSRSASMRTPTRSRSRSQSARIEVTRAALAARTASQLSRQDSEGAEHSGGEESDEAVEKVVPRMRRGRTTSRTYPRGANPRPSSRLAQSPSASRSRSASRRGSRSRSRHASTDDESRRNSSRRWQRHAPMDATYVQKQQTVIKRTALLDNTLSILYLALWTLRLPIHLIDLRRLLLSKLIPYLEALERLPKSLMYELSTGAVAHLGLDAQRVPTVDTLHANARGLIRQMAAVTGIVPPPMNVAPLLWSCTRRLLLPPSAYLAAKSILAYTRTSLHLSGEFHRAASTFREQQDSNTEEDEEKERVFYQESPTAFSERTYKYPKEVLLMAALVIVVKMRYGLDGLGRIEDPKSLTSMPKMDDWLEALENLGKAYDADPLGVHNTMTDVLDMSDEQLDAFLEHSEETLVLKNEAIMHQWRNHEITKPLLTFDDETPVRRPERRSSSEPDNELRARERNLIKAIEELYSRDAPTKQKGKNDGDGSPRVSIIKSRLKPGQAYQQFAPPASASSTKRRTPGKFDLAVHSAPHDLPDEFRLVLAVAAAVIGCEITTLDAVVALMEQQIRVAAKLQRRITKYPREQQKGKGKQKAGEKNAR